MPLDSPSSSRNIPTSHSDSEARGKGATTVLASGATTLAKSKRRKGRGSGTATPALLDEEELPATFEKPSFEDNVDFIAFEPELSSKEDQGELRVGERDRDTVKSRERDGGDSRKRKLDFDQSDGYNNKKERTNAASRKAPWVTDVDWEGSTNVAELLHREVEAFVKYVSPTREEDEVRSLAVAHISQVITRKFPDAKVLAFGSYETKLYLPLGDIDLVVLSQSMAHSDRTTVLHALANTLKRGGITDKVTIIAKAKVPIVKFITTHGYFPVDISINQENGVEAGRVVSGFLSEMPALRALVLVAKAFLSQRSMNEVFSGGLGSYSIICLAVSFLQMHPKIRRGEINPARNLGVLVMEFFEHYGCYFNYHEVGISLRDGGTYFSKVQRGWMDYKQSLLSIEDPADSTNDISKGSYNIARVRQTFAGAHDIMKAAVYIKAGILNSRRSGRSVNLRGYTEATDLSILSSVLGVTQEVRRIGIVVRY
ncbi:Nucleotidyltransferase [Lactarius quietus]|nr:Nucleotidyltransferase [Lactarius quietus]